MKKTVLITGASSGFGKETAHVFHRNGWNVIATMRSPENEQELTSLENVLVTKLDVQDDRLVALAVEAGIEKFGTIDVLVNNAGYGLMGVFESASPAQIQKQFDVNVFGMMRVTKAVLPYMRKNGRGVIVNLSSFGGVVGLPFASLYASSKFAVEGFSEALSHELSDFDIRVKIIEPGGVNTHFRGGLDMIKSDIEAYHAGMSAFFANYGKATQDLPKATVTDVAETIFQAATENNTQLRYVIGSDAQFWIDTKNDNEEARFVQSVRDLLMH